MICTHYTLGWTIKVNELSGVHGTKEGKEEYLQSYGGNSWRHYFEELGRVRRVILKYILNTMDVKWIHVAQKRDQWHAFVNMLINFGVPQNVWDFFTSSGSISILRSLFHGVLTVLSHEIGNCHCSVHNSLVGTLCLVTMQDIFSASIVCMNDLITSGVGTCFGWCFLHLLEMELNVIYISWWSGFFQLGVDI